MKPLIKLPIDTPRARLVEFVDVISLRNTNKIEMLERTLISRDKNGDELSFFGDLRWRMGVYSAEFLVTKKSDFDFSFLVASESLLLELKLIVYGWIFQKNSTRSSHIKIQTLVNRLGALKKVYTFLEENKYDSISVLNNKLVSNKLDLYLTKKDLAQRTLEHVYAGINSIVRLQSWLQIELSEVQTRPYEYASKLSNKCPQQTLAIPERIADELFAKAIQFVEEYYPYKDLLSALEKELQDNYVEGKAIVENKISNGDWKFLNNTKNNHSKAQEIYKNLPIKPNEIISKYTKGPLSCLKTAVDWKILYGRITTACYVCCGAFSGMRDSELSVLEPSSYFQDVIDGQTYHFIRSKMFKLGEKYTTWITAPISGKAIALMKSLSESWREELKKEGLDKQSKYLWLNRTARSKLPVVITKWSERLQRFSESFDIIITKEDLDEVYRSNPNAIQKIKDTCAIGEKWPLKPHQFRRSLALYITRNRLGSSSTIKQQYKHIYLQMSEWYQVGGRANRLEDLRRDRDFQDLLRKTKLEETTSKFFNMINSGTTLSGSHGKAIMEMREDIPYMYSSWEVIYEAVKKGTLSLHGTMHSYCKNGYDCDMEGVVNPAFCVDCKSGGSIIDREHAKNWLELHSRLTTYLYTNTNVSVSIYSHCITQIRAAESVLNDFDIPYVEYTHSIEVHHHD